MSIFSETKIQLTTTENINQISLSNVSIIPSIAICTISRILFYNESGEKFDFELYKGVPPTYIEYHPFLPQLAIGWQNGVVTLFNEDQKMIKEEAGVHKSPIILIVFQPSGNCMVTTDDKGFVAVWRGIICLSTYQREGAITNCIFCELNFPEKEASSQKLKSTNLFFFGGKSGVVCLADSSNHCSEVCKVGGAIKSLLFYEKENSVIIITSTLLLVQFRISPNEKTAPDKKVKLSIAGDPEKLVSIWIGSCLLATCSNENMLRFWHLENDENYVLTLFDVEQVIGGLNTFTDKIISIKYENKGKVLVGGTKEGKVLFWKHQGFGNSSPSDSDQWKAMPFISMDQGINSITSGLNNGLIAVRSGNSVSLISETVVNGKSNKGLKILQTASNTLQVYVKNDIVDQMFLFSSKNNIKGMDCLNNTIVICTGKKVEIYEIVSNLQEGSVNKIDEFSEKCSSIAIHNENIILIKEKIIQTTSFKGLVKQTINFAESEGQIRNFNILNNYMIVFTTKNFMKIFDISRKEFKQLGITRRFEDSSGPLGELKSCVINSVGSKIGILCNSKKGAIETKFYIYDLDMDSFVSYDMGSNRIPVSIMWDKNDQRFFIVQTSYHNAGVKQEDLKPKEEESPFLPNHELKFSEEWKGYDINTFFCTSETGIKKQDNYRVETNFEALFSLAAPKVYYIYRSSENDISKNFKIHEEILKDFSGIDKIDDVIVKSIMNFSFYLTTGNMDEAYKSVKSIQNPIIWENMAQMCVKTQRIDVAEICIGNMRFARGARAIRESKNEDQLEAKLAMVAIQLNMKDEAENLYKSCKRYDLINKMYQASGEWDKAIKIAESQDRINLKTTYYKTAKLLEISRDFEKAIFYYEKSGTHRKEVPRMLMCCNKIKILENYIEEKKDKELYKWWAQYLESQEKYDQALNYYKLADDFSSIVRLLIFQGDITRAKDICKETNDTAACYYLAKQLELKDSIEEAVTFYAMAQYYSQAVKLARERGLENDIMSLSLKSPTPVMLQSAAYFEHKGHNEKAVILYMKGSNLKKALDIAVKAKLYDYVKKISAEINPDADDELLTKLSKTFLDGNQNEQAVHLLIASKQIEKALELCIQNNIPITEDIVKKMIPEKKPDNVIEEKKRQDLIRLISKKAKKQGNFELASKYYIELGEKVKAIKCLIKLGDIDRVITFANNARVIEIYILAANYLQTADWHKNPDIIKYIITFYSKSKAFDRLANFYDECAGVEIDEYRDYEKALSALKDATKHAIKSTAADKDAKLQQLQQKVFFVEKFIQSKQFLSTKPKEMIKICQQLIEDPNIEFAIRAGDVYAQMIEYYHEVKEYQLAYTLIQRMQDKGIILNPYLDQGIIENVFAGVGKTNVKKGKQQEEEEVENFQEEELLE